MTLPSTVADVLADRVAFEVECIDRMYRSVYVPQLQRELGLIGYLRGQLGCTVSSTAPLAPVTGAFSAAVRGFARDHGIPIRVRGSSIYMPATSAPGIHPRDLPEPLRSALIGPRARSRLHRLLFIAGHPSITAAAQALGIWHSALHHQVVLLERASGGQLVNRRLRPGGTTILTPLGRQLCQQARDYLGIWPGPGTP